MNNNTTKLNGRHGFLLQEIIVGLVIFSIAMVPIMRSLVMIPQIAATACAQIRMENWRSAQDQAIALGLDGSSTGLLRSVTSSADTQTLAGRIQRSDLAGRPGNAQVNLLSENFDDVSEPRSIAAGFEISAAITPPPTRTDPLAPLAAIKLAAPSLSPANGTFVNVLALAASSGGLPATLDIQASGPNSENFLHLQEASPTAKSMMGLGVARLTVDAAALAQSVSGVAWTEYAGNQTTDTKVILSDGRSRWLVAVNGQTQVYEPSDLVKFVYGVDLGRPIYRLGSVEYVSGDSVSVDFPFARTVEQGLVAAQITYSNEVQSHFGNAWPTISPRFDWGFGGFTGDSSAGNTFSIFTAKGRTAWNDQQVLTATPISELAGLRAFGATWTVSRSATVLQAPERISSFYDGQVDELGAVDFSAPAASFDGVRYGRPEVGSIESVDTTLSLPLIP